MTDSAKTLAIVAPFEPKETISVKIANNTINVYPRIDPLMSIAERAHAYHVTRSALNTLPLPPDAHHSTSWSTYASPGSI